MVWRSIQDTHVKISQETPDCLKMSGNLSYMGEKAGFTETFVSLTGKSIGSVFLPLFSVESGLRVKGVEEMSSQAGK